MNLLGAVRKLLGRDELPPGFPGKLDDDERVLAVAPLTEGGHVVVTSVGLWLPVGRGEGAEGVRRIGWHLVSKATWQSGVITVVEAEELEVLDGAVLLSDLPAQRLKLAEPGRVPETVQARVEGSIRSRHRRDLPGGGAWFVQRKVAGRDGIVLQVRPDPGTDEAAVRQVAGDVGRALGLGPG